MKTTATLLALTAVASLGACNGNNRVSYSDITSDPNPELKGLAQRPADEHNAFAIGASQNLRMIHDDLNRTFLLDHPSRLSPFPIIYTSGQPR